MAKIDPEIELSPTENLIVEVLVARYRLGEKTWNFDLAVGKYVSSLVQKGYVKQFQKQDVIVVGLTDEAIAMNLTYDYIPSIAGGSPELVEIFRGVTLKAQELKKQLDKKHQPKQKTDKKKSSSNGDSGSETAQPPSTNHPTNDEGDIVEHNEAREEADNLSEKSDRESTTEAQSAVPPSKS